MRFVSVARRYGPLTSFGYSKPGEPLELWYRLINQSRGLAQAWNADGTLRAGTAYAGARVAAIRLSERSVRDHQHGGGEKLPHGFCAAMQCDSLMSFFQRDAISDVAAGAPMRQCR